ncbi:uncharacterized protein Dwil_GK27638 [Drosophila willistoni]|uniref:Uncharacterized protein n=1 Tax=Drosophila willistoni TaxID=7260 RepID=A0A0Q9WZK4_DROWI|nr:uncharacterized protein Dwil_GK27278 [Drosophila willistoni]KRF98118.1 uncharacterized protein Dwil_GK27638 [Drosophila willistoni]
MVAMESRESFVPKNANIKLSWARSPYHIFTLISITANIWFQRFSRSASTKAFLKIASTSSK